jgi:hypothetical protein
MSVFLCGEDDDAILTRYAASVCGPASCKVSHGVYYFFEYPFENQLKKDTNRNATITHTPQYI